MTGLKSHQSRVGTFPEKFASAGKAELIPLSDLGRVLELNGIVQVPFQKMGHSVGVLSSGYDFSSHRSDSVGLGDPGALCVRALE